MRSAGILPVFALAMLTSCGSGSSGFDGASSETEALLLAMRSGDCVGFDGTPYCGSGARIAIDHTRASVEVAEATDSVVCTDVPDEPSCTASVGFSSDGLPPGAQLIAASAQGVDGPWTLATIDPEPGTDEPAGEVDVTLPDSGQSGPPSEIVVAVLVYLEGAPASLPDQAPLLGDFGADIVFVSSAVDVEAAP